jgi:hypothetical protein
MPVAAPGLPDVLVGDTHPPVLVGFRDHLLDQLAVLLLEVHPARQIRPGLLEAACQRVTYGLEIGDTEHPWAARGRDAELDPAAGEGAREELPELALELADLATQIVPRAPLRVFADPGAAAACRRDTGARRDR